MLTIDDEEDDSWMFEAVTELNVLEQPEGVCQWDRGCNEPATHNVVK